MQRFAVESVVPAALVLVVALLLSPVLRAVTASFATATDRTWPFSLERPRGGFALGGENRGG